MPWGLKRFHQTRQLHFLTFSCYKRRPKFGTPESRSTLEAALERVRQQHELCVYSYVVMPEHVHMLVSEPERGTLAQAIQSLKQGVARRLALRAADSFWQARYYDFNVWEGAGPAFLFHFNTRGCPVLVTASFAVTGRGIGL